MIRSWPFLYLVSLGLRVAYIDIDAHHGDGVQEAFYGTNRVLTVSFHQNGRTLFPSTGFVSEMGRGAGPGIRSMCLFSPGPTIKSLFGPLTRSFRPCCRPFSPKRSSPSWGWTRFIHDPLANLSLTTQGFCHAVRFFKGFNKPWVALGGGGYHQVEWPGPGPWPGRSCETGNWVRKAYPTRSRRPCAAEIRSENWLCDEEHREEDAKWQRADSAAKATVRAVQESIFRLSWSVHRLPLVLDSYVRCSKKVRQRVLVILSPAITRDEESRCLTSCMTPSRSLPRAENRDPSLRSG